MAPDQTRTAICHGLGLFKQTALFLSADGDHPPAAAFGAPENVKHCPLVSLVWLQAQRLGASQSECTLQAKLHSRVFAVTFHLGNHRFVVDTLGLPVLGLGRAVGLLTPAGIDQHVLQRR